MTRQLLVRLNGGQLPNAIQDTLRDEVVLAGWVRASGVLADVTLKSVGSSEPRRYAGIVHAVSLQGSVGMMNGDVSVGLHAVLAQDADGSAVVLAGEIVDARVVALEVHVSALDELAATRSADASGLVLLDPVVVPSAPALPATAPSSPNIAPPPPPAPPPTLVQPAAAPPPPPAPVAVASVPDEPAKPRPSPTFMSSVMPQRIQKPAVAQSTETQFEPEAGDKVEHFAFGACEVMKSDGERLHVRLEKDGRIKEISLEMLKVTELPTEPGGKRHFKLARKL